jgi:hypothetical protein
VNLFIDKKDRGPNLKVLFVTLIMVAEAREPWLQRRTADLGPELEERLLNGERWTGWYWSTTYVSPYREDPVGPFAKWEAAEADGRKTLLAERKAEAAADAQRDDMRH